LRDSRLPAPAETIGNQIMNPVSISKTTHRRFLLGKQGLWPGRRFTGVDGVTAALNQMEALQLDPLNVIARSQDIALWGRVLDYRPEHLYQAVYDERRFFDYGGSLYLYPMSELPYWRLHMRHRGESGRWGPDFASEHATTLDYLREELQANGPRGNRDFKGAPVSGNYRGRKDTSIALYYLWITGEIMIHHRQGFDRYYDLRERIAPPEYDYAASYAEAEDFFSTSSLSFLGLMREKRWRNSFADDIWRGVSPEEAKERLAKLYEQNIIAPVQIEGSKEQWIALTKDLPLLETLESGKTPSEWEPLGPSTQEEITFLAPLEIVSARGRAKQVFDFEYIWEVYKPLKQRRWGYYVLPILYGDTLVARLDPKLDRKTMTLQVNGFWLEDDAPAADPAFADALGKGLARFANFVEAKKVDIDSIAPKKLQNHIQKFLTS
jgi:hypothetical protein